MDAVFFPRNDYPGNVEICSHRLGKRITIAETTTMIPYWVSQKLLPYIVSLNRTHGLKVGAFFDNNHNEDPSYSTASYLGSYVMEQIANGVICPDLYFLSNPTDDYSNSAQESNKQVLWSWFQEKFGKIPTAILFGLMPGPYGSYMQQYILSGDSNNVGNGTDYGNGVGLPNNIPYSKEGYYHRNWNKRALDDSLSDENYSARISQVSDLIDNTKALPNGGLIYNFNHWHNLLYKDIDRYTGEPIEGRNYYAIENGFIPYFNMLAEKNANNDVCFCGYGEAIAYLVYRESISKIAMYSPFGKETNTLVIRLEARNIFGIDTKQFQVPVSLSFTTEGTPLEGMEIRSNCNLIGTNTNEYIVEIPWNEYPECIIKLAE